MERSVTLAAAMDSRGYGRRGDIHRRDRRVTSALLLGGLVAACIGVFGLVSADSPVLMGLPMLALGTAASVLALVRAGRSRVRTRYRPDPWATAEWCVSLAGVTAALVFSAGAWLGAAGREASSQDAVGVARAAVVRGRRPARRSDPGGHSAARADWRQPRRRGHRSGRPCRSRGSTGAVDV